MKLNVFRIEVKYFFVFTVRRTNDRMSWVSGDCRIVLLGTPPNGWVGACIKIQFTDTFQANA